MAAWYCHDCEHTAMSVGAARTHAKAAPVYRRGGMWRHVLTRNAESATVDRERDADAREYVA